MVVYRRISEFHAGSRFGSGICWGARINLLHMTTQDLRARRVFPSGFLGQKAVWQVPSLIAIVRSDCRRLRDMGDILGRSTRSAGLNIGGS